jgi:hypothetical protein
MQYPWEIEHRRRSKYRALPGWLNTGFTLSRFLDLSAMQLRPHAQSDQGEKAMTGTAKPTVFEDNERVCVTEWRFAAKGDDTGWHKHGFDYVVVPMRDGVLEIAGAHGKMTKAELKKGTPYFREAGVEHNVINGNDFEFVFVEIEIK